MFYDSKKFVSRTLVLLAASIISCTVNAEYIIFKNNAGKLTAPSIDEFERTAPLFDKYQFPRSLQHKNLLNKELSSAELEQLATKEHQFIQQKIDQLGLNLTVIFVPTTLWELIVLHKLTEESRKDPRPITQENPFNLHHLIDLCSKKALEQYEKTIGPAPKHPTLPEGVCFIMLEGDAQKDYEHKREIFHNFLTNDANFKAIRKSFLQEKLATLPQGILISYAMYMNNSTSSARFEYDGLSEYFEKSAPVVLGYYANNQIIAYLASSSLAREAIVQGKNKLLEPTIGEIIERTMALNKIIEEKVYNNSYWAKQGSPSHNRTFSCPSSQIAEISLVPYFKKIVEHEIKANNEGAYILYRGTNGFQGCIDKIVKTKGYDGLSYGNTLFAGLLRDSSMGQSACAFEYMKGQTKIFYTVAIDKRDQIIKSPNFSASKFFQIPAVNTLAGLLLGKGEAFHARAFQRDAAQIPSEMQEQCFQEFLKTNAQVIK